MTVMSAIIYAKIQTPSTVSTRICTVSASATFDPGSTLGGVVATALRFYFLRLGLTTEDPGFEKLKRAPGLAYV
jgi:hypothetical protein